PRPTAGAAARPRGVRRHRGRAMPRPAASGRAQRPLRAAARDPLRGPPGPGRCAVDARRHDGRLPVGRAGRDPAHAQVSRRQIRGVLALPAIGAFGAFLAWGFTGLAPFGRFHGFYGQLLNAIALPQRHTTNTVTAVVFDYRGIDTMGEELILFASVVGVVLLLRETGRPTRADIARDQVRSDALHVFGVVGAGA